MKKPMLAKLYVDVSNADYRHIGVRFGQMAEDRTHLGFRYLTTVDIPYEERPQWEHLEIRSQSHKEKDGLWKKPYGFKLTYEQPYSVDLRRAQAMVKMLTTVERKLAKIQAFEGSDWDDLGSYVNQVLRALGIKTLWANDGKEDYPVALGNIKYAINKIWKSWNEAEDS
jgi:hypothetical protein